MVPLPPVVGVGVVPPPAGVVPAALVVAALGVVEEAAALVEPAVVALEPGVVVELDVVEELDELEPAAGAAAALPALGTVNGGAPAMSGVVEPPPPQAAKPTVNASEASAAVRRGKLRRWD
ncbi:MAG: hypothetical protein ACR2NR_04110 [Solirubrobacteraceae bacterium]